MKRIIWLLTLVAILPTGMTAFADSTNDTFTEPAEYTGGDKDKVSLNASNYSTVLITKADDSAPLTGNKIMYVAQNDSAFGAASEFFIKTNPAFGKYSVKLGSESGETYETYFYVGVDSPNTDDKAMTRLQKDEGEDKHNIGYFTTVSGEDYDGFTAIKVCYMDNDVLTYGGFPIERWDKTVYTGPGKLTLVFQLNDVPTEWKDAISVYLTKDVLTENEGTSTVPGGGN